MSERDIAQTNIVQNAESFFQRWNSVEELVSFFGRYGQYVGNGFSFVVNIKGVVVVALAFAHVVFDENVG